MAKVGRVSQALAQLELLLFLSTVLCPGDTAEGSLGPVDGLIK